MAKTHFKKLFNTDYLGAWDVEDKDLIRTIANIGESEITGSKGKKEKVVLCRFKEGGKPMVLNVTNCKTIAKMYGSKHIEDWVGKPIQIYATEVRFGAEMVDALRVRPIKPKIGNEAQKLAIKKQIINALSNLPDTVQAEWRARLKQAKQEGKDTIQNLKTALKKISEAI